MKPRYVIDTNVLIAASAADPRNPSDIDATPRDPVLRETVWRWLGDFQASESRIVLDSEMRILDEYQRKLRYDSFGVQVVIDRFTRCACDLVEVTYDADGHGELSPELTALVHDRADRKMVAAAIGALELHGKSCIAFAGDTDWHGWEDTLRAVGLDLEPIIEAWSRQRYEEKKG